jgi:predicted dehydrogenase
MKESTNKVIGKGGATRREFLKKSTLAAAAVAATQNMFKTPVYGQNQAPAPGNVVGANNRIVVGYIGLGLQGLLAHVKFQKENAVANNVAQAAVCDLSAHRQAAAKDAILADKDGNNGTCDTYDDYRKLLERKDIDAVTLSTTDPWHATIAIDAVKAGKHVYGEKPLARYLGEAFQIYEAVKASKKIFQIGSQGTSDAKWSKVAELVKDGKLGALVLGQDSYMRNSLKGEWNIDCPDWATEKDLDWVKWQGQVKNKTPFNREAYFRWRKYYPYCAGPLGDLCPHRLHPMMLATGNPEFPRRVVCLGQNPVHADKPEDKNAEVAPERDCPEDIQLIAEFPSGLALLMISGTVNQVGLESVMRTHKATLLMSGNRVQLNPEKDFGEEIDPQTFDNLQPSEDIAVHEKNWFESIRADKQPNGNIDLAIRVQTVLSLAEMSNRLNMVCLFDEKTRKITNGEGKEVPAITYGTLDKS